MSNLLFILVITVVLINSVFCKQSQHDHLSKESHFTDDNHHNPEYDHEAFLGADESKAFDNLSPEESKDRLSKIVDKIDTNNDGKVSFDELRIWIHKSQAKYILDDVERQWKTHRNSDKDLLSWSDYKKSTYGFMDDLDSGVSEEDAKVYNDMMRRDERRWKAADVNGDDLLTKEEFTNFLHPEEADHMKNIVIDETLEDVDKDGDGKISLNEYISDMYSGSDGADSEVPDWVLREKDQFNTIRDKDKDGFLDRNEVKDWIIPDDSDLSGVEAKHLVSESDEDKDGYLTKEEILNNYDLFVGSQATDFGEALMKHDEL
ncbi:calumenin-A [Tetranychus urticae]|uniref:Reticulocalbin-3 n=1 Tax=Tetranychus urticae TaxID=32264 RepID=T1KBD9_TETUR|nr:calumenin-A [Tetranychus urticae]